MIDVPGWPCNFYLGPSLDMMQWHSQFACDNVVPGKLNETKKKPHICAVSLPSMFLGSEGPSDEQYDQPRAIPITTGKAAEISVALFLQDTKRRKRDETYEAKALALTLFPSSRTGQVRAWSL